MLADGASYEMIELQRLEPRDRLDLTQSSRSHRLERTNAVRIPPGRVAPILQRSIRRRVLGVTNEPSPPGRVGEGHYFQPTSHTQYTWCDLCGDFIWGIYRKSLRCMYCNFTCHYRCRAFIQLDCSRGDDIESEADSVQETSWEKDTNVDEKPEKTPVVLSHKEIEQKIKDYNSQIKSNLFMSLNKDGSYTGFIKVQLKLIRPVSVPVTKKPTCSDRKNGGRSQTPKRRTSFYLPKDASKHLHLSSRTPASEVIQALLRKFTVLDNPRKFALFQRTEQDKQVSLRKLSDDEEPLKLRLLSGPCDKTLSFVLKENETGEVNWDAFSMPELQNFLRILQREEEEHMRQIIQRYTRCRQQMQEELASRTPG
ncbi:ras association domain-containing protein 1 isoform X1 [Bombina bombina]|uniref:ras association domain-containing protein 1 isoform X1 n=1 Tax=Bombina bombina TaxID=8345 RepID=UPI00235AF9B8|nr:ras association domain-containing protein 1 isoform X1 [Bombina bombina]